MTPTGKRLSKLAYLLKYTCELVPGVGGRHFIADKRITVGADQGETEQDISLAHELGHAINMAKEPLSDEELLAAANDWDAYEKSSKNLVRELAAWGIADRLLEQFGWGTAEEWELLGEIRLRSLRAYWSTGDNVG